MKPLEMVRVAMVDGKRDDVSSVTRFIIARWGEKLIPMVVGRLISRVRKELAEAPRAPLAEVKQPWKGTVEALEDCKKDVGVKVGEGEGAMPVKTFTVQFGEEVVRDVIELIKKHGYDQVRGAIELSRWFYS